MTVYKLCRMLTNFNVAGYIEVLELKRILQMWSRVYRNDSLFIDQTKLFIKNPSIHGTCTLP